jgi:NTE family protein
MPWSKMGWIEELFSNSGVIYLKYDQNISLSRKFVFQPGLFAGGIINSSEATPLQHLFGFGGLNTMNYIGSYVDFTGVQFIQQFGYYAAIVRLKMQYNFYQKLYLTLRSDFGSNQLTLTQLANGKNMLAGYGLTASYNSFIGPIELTVMGSNINPKPLLFLNIGFWF